MLRPAPRAAASSVDLLRQILLMADLRDLVALSLDPADVVLLISCFISLMASS
jgi:hypothetical protein